MSLPYDATLKVLFRRTEDWLRQIGVEVGGPIEEIDAELSTVSADADKVFRVNEAEPSLLHLEVQSSRDASLPRRLLQYNGQLHARHQLPVRSVAILLRRQANDPDLLGFLAYHHPILGGVRFEYLVVRVWEWPVEALLSGGLGTFPLAPLSAEVNEENLAAVVQRMDERLRTVDPQEAGELWTATNVLLGLRFSRELAEQVLRGVRAMKDSVTYQWIVEQGVQKGREEGRQEGLREGMVAMLLRQGEKKFGAPDLANRNTLAEIADLDRLNRIGDRLNEAADWRDWLATP
jgi:predicted transposase YdaD